MEKYIALIIKHNDYYHKHYVISAPNESKERFTKRIRDCYIEPYNNIEYDIEIYLLIEQLR